MSARQTLTGALVVLVSALSALPASAAAGAGAAPAGAAPVVQSMIVGAGGRILSPARSVSANATSVGVARHSCAVAAATPLAVLAAVRRAGGPGYALRDYGRCGASPANSGALFVYSLGGEMNRGQDGWEYKVNGRSGSTGAGDPIGPRGDGGRLSPGAQVLWFWCAAVAGGCQRSLELSAPGTSVARGGRMTVSVRARDNEGRASAVAGAIVTLGSDFASTNAAGQATLIAPGAPGRYQLAAKRNALVPSFPETIVVG
ncbi:MAG: hypothetical protein H0X28_14055 [Solirubrobacterales bacterium]|nr:hypothetical protein [Solirubrobacterales bacterium]